MANSNLRRCNFMEKGIWVDALCLMHQQVEYGVLRWPLKEIAEAVKCRPADLQTLVRKGVLKGADDELTKPYVYTPRSGRKDGEPVVLIESQPGPIWYSSRMVRDEYVRRNRGEGSRFGDTNDATPDDASKHAPKPPFGDGSSSSSSSSIKKTCSKRAASNVQGFPPGFEEFWKTYPKRKARADAIKAFARLRPDADLLQTMLAAITAQASTENWRKNGGEFIPMPATWLNGQRWLDEIPSGGQSDLDAIFRRGAQ
ncbi:MAG: hypothetical protein ACKVOX_05645 [Rhizobacter sp.]